jgi:hypothetical protein
LARAQGLGVGVVGEQAPALVLGVVEQQEGKARLRIMARAASVVSPVAAGISVAVGVGAELGAAGKEVGVLPAFGLEVRHPVAAEHRQQDEEAQQEEEIAPGRLVADNAYAVGNADRAFRRKTPGR